MDDPGGSTYVLAFICLILSAIFSGSEAVLLSADEIRLKTRYAKNRCLELVLDLQRDMQNVISTLLLEIPS